METPGGLAIIEFSDSESCSKGVYLLVTDPDTYVKCTGKQYQISEWALVKLDAQNIHYRRIS